MQQYKVQRQEAANFAKVWNHKGVALVIQDAHIEFATDFANVVLRNFIQMCQQQVTNANSAKPEPKKLIVEG